MTSNPAAATWAQGRVAFITGATAGFGRALARRLLAAGAHVVATGRRRERLAELEAETGHTDRLHTATLDLTAGPSIDACIEALPERFQAIDALINNAGLGLGLAPAHQAQWSDWEQMIATNVTGLVRITHKLLPGMAARGKGDVINLASVAANYPYPGGNVYAATKAFVRHFSLGLRADLLGAGIRVTSIEPGMCETEFSVVRFKGDAERAAKVYEGMTPLSADDIAGVIETILALPPHVNVNTIELMPVAQAFSPFAVHRGA